MTLQFGEVCASLGAATLLQRADRRWRGWLCSADERLFAQESAGDRLASAGSEGAPRGNALTTMSRGTRLLDLQHTGNGCVRAGK